jgi:hypothetical protein
MLNNILRIVDEVHELQAALQGLGAFTDGDKVKRVAGSTKTIRDFVEDCEDFWRVRWAKQSLIQLNLLTEACSSVKYSQSEGVPASSSGRGPRKARACAFHSLRHC